MNRLAVTATIVTVEAMPSRTGRAGGNHALVTHRVVLSLDGPYGLITCYAYQIGATLLGCIGKVMRVEITPGPLGLRIVSICTDYVTDDQ